MGNFPHGRGMRVADDDQVIVVIERKMIGIERPLRQRRCPVQLLGKCARSKQRQRRSKRQSAPQHRPTRDEGLNVCHGLVSLK